MTRREALGFFGAVGVGSVITDIADPWKLESRISRKELKKLVRDLDVTFPRATDLVGDLPEHIRRMNLILKALAEEIL
jgi:hypothetical protein